MKISRPISITLWFIPVVLVVSIGAAIFFIVFQKSKIETQKNEEVQPLIEVLEKLKVETIDHAGWLQAKILSSFSEEYRHGFKTERISPTAYRERFEQETDPTFLQNPSLKTLTDKLTELESTQKEISLYLTAHNGDNPDKVKAAQTYSQRATAIYHSIDTALAQLLAQQRANLSELDKKAKSAELFGLLALGVGFVLTLILLIIAMAALERNIKVPLSALIKRMPSRQRLIVEPTELGQIATYINTIHTEALETENVLNALIQGLNTGQLTKPDHVNERIWANVTTLQSRFAELTAEYHTKESEYKALQTRLINVEQELRRSGNIAAYQSKVLQEGVALFEVNAGGRLVSANDIFLRMTGLSLNEAQLMDFSAAGGGISAEALADMWATVRTGRSWQGLLPQSLQSGKKLWLATTTLPMNGNGNDRFICTTYDVTPLISELEGLKASLLAVRRELDETRNKVALSQNEYDGLRQSIESHKLLEYRLVQQQAALQELTRNQDLKQGFFREALRSLTETTVYALDEERAGLWLFADSGSTLTCLDLYERQRMAHRDGLQLKRQAFPDFFQAIQQDKVIAIEQPEKDPKYAPLFHDYLRPLGDGSFMLAPIHLGGKIVGVIMVEHEGYRRTWAMDEQNFLLSVAEVVSLALEQGNRKAMEEELRITLEEARTLEEELRQSLEEMEAANEEMQRTQFELKAQISAMNNASIVVETTPDGRIVYVNQEFINVYGYTPDELLGKTHVLIKSDYHTPEFFARMWDAINNGRVWRAEIKNKAKDGSEKWMFTTITPVISNDGKIQKFIAVSYDITAQKQQEEQIKDALQIALEQEDLLRSSSTELLHTNEEMRRTQLELAGQLKALNNSSLVYETDFDGVIKYINDEFVKVLKYEREELLNQKYTIFRGRQPEVVYNDMWRTVRAGKIWRGELELRNKENKFVWVVITSTPVISDNGTPIKCINVLFDVSEQKQQEYRLKKQQSALLEVNNHTAIKEGKFKEAFHAILQTGLEVLGVNRASIWLNIEGGARVRCEAVLDGNDYKFGEGTILDKDLYPIYFRTLESDRIMAVTEAKTDYRTKELAVNMYIDVEQVSTLDVTIRQGNKSVGILSFEQKNTLHEWTLDEQNFVTSLADTVSVVLEQKERKLNLRLKQLYAKLEEANREVVRQKEEIENQKKEVEETIEMLGQSIKYAKRIQTNILPSKEILDRFLRGKENYFVVHRQKDEVGGDFYWFSAVDSKRIIAVADGTGHGVPGAFLTLIGYLLLNQIVNEKKILQPNEILYHLHLGVREALKQDAAEADETIKATSRDGMDIAICCIDFDTLELQYSGANLPLYYYQDWEVHQLKPSKKSIGGEQLEEERTFENYSIQLKHGDAIYMYTDGFVDQFGGPEEKRFSTKRFRDLILRTQHESMATQRALLNMEWKEWKEDREQIDDVTVFGLKV